MPLNPAQSCDVPGPAMALATGGGAIIGDRRAATDIGVVLQPVTAGAR